jgi:hypothetical protein
LLFPGRCVRGESQKDTPSDHIVAVQGTYVYAPGSFQLSGGVQNKEAERLGEEQIESVAGSMDALALRRPSHCASSPFDIFRVQAIANTVRYTQKGLIFCLASCGLPSIPAEAGIFSLRSRKLTHPKPISVHTACWVYVQTMRYLRDLPRLLCPSPRPGPPQLERMEKQVIEMRSDGPSRRTGSAASSFSLLAPDVNAEPKRERQMLWLWQKRARHPGAFALLPMHLDVDVWGRTGQQWAWPSLTNGTREEQTRRLSLRHPFDLFLFFLFWGKAKPNKTK